MHEQKSALAQHYSSSGHAPDFGKAEVLATESNFRKRRVKEAIYIYQEMDPLNRDEGAVLPPQFKPLVKGKGSTKFHQRSQRVQLLPTF